MLLGTTPQSRSANSLWAGEDFVERVYDAWFSHSHHQDDKMVPCRHIIQMHAGNHRPLSKFAIHCVGASTQFKYFVSKLWARGGTMEWSCGASHHGLCTRRHIEDHIGAVTLSLSNDTAYKFSCAVFYASCFDGFSICWQLAATIRTALY